VSLHGGIHHLVGVVQEHAGVDENSLHEGDGDNTQACPLVDLLLPSRPFLSHGFQGRGDLGQHGENDGCRDVGHDAQSEDRRLADGTTRERRQEPKDPGIRAALDEIDAHSRQGYLEAHAIADQQAQGPEDLLPCLRDTE
jgi:hypothetical protein